ncbi:uncharacterized protein LOC115513921 isoform X2 [Lynx canadensis]|nr:uncharacterized protein LOC115513921 isoform X2 [Lynx canadensis]
MSALRNIEDTSVTVGHTRSHWKSSKQASSSRSSQLSTSQPQCDKEEEAEHERATAVAAESPGASVQSRGCRLSGLTYSTCSGKVPSSQASYCPVGARFFPRTSEGGCAESPPLSPSQKLPVLGTSLSHPGSRRGLMAGGGTHLLLSVLLMLLASSGSWGQKSLLLHKLEGETVSVKCLYPPWTGSNMMRVWCRDISADTCIVLASNTRLPRVSGEPRNSIQDYSSLGYFIVTMTELRVKDSGFYSCGFYKSSEISVLGKFRLVVSRATTTPTTTSTRSTTAWTSAASPVTDSSESNWRLIIPTSTVAVLLLLVLMVLMILYFKKARGSAGKGEDKLHVYDNISVQREKTTEHRKDSSSGQRRSQGSHQQMGSDEDSGAICYASLTHLNNFDLEDSIYVNTHPNLRPTPDPLLTVEYASISGSRPQPSNLTALEGETQELKADFTGQ